MKVEFIPHPYLYTWEIWIVRNERYFAWEIETLGL